MTNVINFLKNEKTKLQENKFTCSYCSSLGEDSINFTCPAYEMTVCMACIKKAFDIILGKINENA